LRLLIADLDPGGVFVDVEPGCDHQAGAGFAGTRFLALWNRSCRAVPPIPGAANSVRKDKDGTLLANREADLGIAIAGKMPSHFVKCLVRAFGAARFVPLTMKPLAAACVR